MSHDTESTTHPATRLDDDDPVPGQDSPAHDSFHIRQKRDVTCWGAPPCSPTCSPCHEMQTVHGPRAEECTASSSARAANVLEQAGAPQL